LSATRQRVVLVDDELKVFREQRPGIEPIPFLADLGGNAEFGLALLEKFSHFVCVAAQEAKLQPVEHPLDLVKDAESTATRSTEWVSAILSAPTSPLLKDEASSRAPVAAS
jgi:hypothetical protein